MISLARNLLVFRYSISYLSYSSMNFSFVFANLCDAIWLNLWFAGAFGSMLFGLCWFIPKRYWPRMILLWSYLKLASLCLGETTRLLYIVYASFCFCADLNLRETSISAI